MDGSIVLGGSQRKRLLRMYRKDPDPQVRLRAQIVHGARAQPTSAGSSLPARRSRPR